VRRRWIAVAGLLAAAATACSVSRTVSIEPGPADTSASVARLIVVAHLHPCPASSSKAVSGGLPDVTLPCLGNGPAVHIAGLTGEPTVVNIWGSWCLPCQAEAGFLSAAYDRTRSMVRFLGVDTQDEAGSALDFGTAVSPPVRYPSVFDENKTVMLDLHFQGPPETLFVDSAGRVVHIHRGPYLTTAAVTADIATYLHVEA
jgi:cytochrome c biogenesis protein CcmG, thiol:disulfide interchange protein DsbE